MAAYGLLEERALAQGDKKEAKALRREMKRLVAQVVMGGLSPPRQIYSPAHHGFRNVGLAG
jgi:hypothetical protein